MSGIRHAIQAWAEELRSATEFIADESGSETAVMRSDSLDPKVESRRSPDGEKEAKKCSYFWQLPWS